MLQHPLPLQILLRAPLHLTGNILYSIMGAENPDYYYICILATTLSTILALLQHCWTQTGAWTGVFSLSLATFCICTVLDWKKTQIPECSLESRRRHATCYSVSPHVWPDEADMISQLTTTQLLLRPSSHNSHIPGHKPGRGLCVWSVYCIVL